ncbi:zinc-binding dehydrogenase [Xenophilus azovorans]|uniref:zinc-binding dehydrogenase n=1 Tax=Xenophilus azovorans TaxID=151755 RepID=UPI001FE06C64|nr:zinc-binding dehydrogenase [Xenophilus azovorans]
MRADGNQSVVDLVEKEVPEPGEAQVLIRVRAAALNRGEFIPGPGLHGQSATPKALGIEGAGEVVKLGAGVTEVAIGARVMARFPAAFADYAIVDLRELIEVPDSLSWEEAASVPLTFMVVYDMLVSRGHLAAGEWVLVTGASSGVGVATLLTAKALGAKVIGISGSAEKIARLKSIGLDVGLQSRADFHAQVLAATDGKGADLAINAVGGSQFGECLKSLAFQGRMAIVGYVDGVLKSEIDIEAVHAKRLNLFGVSNKHRSPVQRAEQVPGFRADVLPHIAAGRIRPTVDRAFDFEHLAQAKAYMESNQHLGKIVLRGRTF